MWLRGVFSNSIPLWCHHVRQCKCTGNFLDTGGGLRRRRAGDLIEMMSLVWQGLCEEEEVTAVHWVTPQSREENRFWSMTRTNWLAGVDSSKIRLVVEDNESADCKEHGWKAVDSKWKKSGGIITLSELLLRFIYILSGSHLAFSMRQDFDFVFSTAQTIVLRAKKTLLNKTQ